jgi:hypothetical protein
MWILENNTPFAAERAWARDRNGAEVWIVAIKGTFTVRPDGSTQIAEEQEPVCLSPEYLGEPGKSDLRRESDLVLTKPSTDVLLLGHAYAPGGKPVQKLPATLKVGDLAKTIGIVGDRYWEKGLLGLKMSEIEPFEKMPLTWERAFGGADNRSPDPKKQDYEPRNPIGAGFFCDAAHCGGQRLPNLQDPNNIIVSWGDRPMPAGFGPVPRDWSPRRELAGTYDEKWHKERHPLLPADFDERHFQCASPDQQTAGYLRGGEPVELHNLTPEGTLKFKLPHLVFGFDTRFTGGEAVHHRAVLHTVILEPDESRVVMVWHTTLPCHPKVNRLERTRIIQKRFI